MYRSIEPTDCPPEMLLRLDAVAPFAL